MPLEAGHHGAQEPVTEHHLRRCVVAGALPGTESGRQRQGHGETPGTRSPLPAFTLGVFSTDTRSPPAAARTCRDRAPQLPAGSQDRAKLPRLPARHSGPRLGPAGWHRATAAAKGPRRSMAGTETPGARARDRGGTRDRAGAALYGAARQFPVCALSSPWRRAAG